MENLDNVRLFRLLFTFPSTSLTRSIPVQPTYGHQCTGLFNELPNKRDYADYYVLIRNPIVRSSTLHPLMYVQAN
jgi:hypothetical protein